jgi:hypothetical protein
VGATENTFYALATAEGIELQRARPATWLSNLGHLNAAIARDTAGTLREIHACLGGDERLLASKRAGMRPRLDFRLPERDLVIEIDEVQHFTSERLESLRRYPRAGEIAFDLEHYSFLIGRWRDTADRYRAAKPAVDFPFAGGRRAQRAYFDACRDLAAPKFALRVLRVPAPECDGRVAYARFKQALEELAA